ncbi:MAG: ATP-binding protein [Bacteroidota bacterium]
MPVKRIAVDGPESTGKSELAVLLAEEFHAGVVPEAARIYLQQLGRTYIKDDLLEIAKLQCRYEDDAALKHNIIFCDTTLLVIKIWSEYKFGNCDPWIEQEYQNRNYDLSLLTNIDLPWQDDPMREHPFERQILFDCYHREMMRKKINYEIITGVGEMRNSRAIEFCKKIINI